MNLESKKALVINLQKREVEAKSFPDLKKYVGGMGLGVKLFQLYKEYDPIVFSIGPLNGLFPFASKTSIILDNGGVVEDLYIGGSLSSRMRFAGLDSIVLLGRSKEDVLINIENSGADFGTSDENIEDKGLPGKRSILKVTENSAFLDSYFVSPEGLLLDKLRTKKVLGMAITGSERVDLLDFEKYNETYYRVLNQSYKATVTPGLYPSCVGCPMGCVKSKTGEIGGNVLLHSLTVCAYAEKIYSDIGVVFSCLNSLGYDYTHEDIENLPKHIEKVLKDLT